MDLRPSGITRVRDSIFTSCGTLGASFSETVNAVTNVPYGGLLLTNFDQQKVSVEGCGFTQSIAGISAIDGALLKITGCTFSPVNTGADGDFTIFGRRIYATTIDENFWTCPASGSANYDLVSLGSTSTVPALAVSFRGNQVRPSGTIDHVLELGPGSGRTVNLNFAGNVIGDDESASDWSITDVIQLLSGTLDGGITDNVIIAGSGTAGCDITRVLESSGGALGTVFAARNSEVEVGSGAITNKINDQIAQDYTVTNGTDDRSFDANAAAGAISGTYTQAEIENIRDAVLELADVVGTVIGDLESIGVTR
jgi:hypothetical protein